MMEHNGGDCDNENSVRGPRLVSSNKRRSRTMKKARSPQFLGYVSGQMVDPIGKQYDLEGLNHAVMLIDPVSYVSDELCFDTLIYCLIPNNDTEQLVMGGEKRCQRRSCLTSSL